MKRYEVTEKLNNDKKLDRKKNIDKIRDDIIDIIKDHKDGDFYVPTIREHIEDNYGTYKPYDILHVLNQLKTQLILFEKLYNYNNDIKIGYYGEEDVHYEPYDERCLKIFLGLFGNRYYSYILLNNVGIGKTKSYSVDEIKNHIFILINKRFYNNIIDYYNYSTFYKPHIATEDIINYLKYHIISLVKSYNYWNGEHYD